MTEPSAIEAEMALHIRALKLPAPEREYKFHPKRRWRFDFAWPAAKPPVALEVEGAVWTGGRHVSGSGFTEDCTKYAEATLLGWRVFRATSAQVKSGEAVRWIQEALA